MTKLRTLTEIALEKQRDILLIKFPQLHMSGAAPEALPYVIDQYPLRIKVLDWLEANNIKYESCLGSLREQVQLKTSLNGNIYIDVPWDVNDEAYKLVQQRLEFSDGTPINPYVWFCYYRLQTARRDAAFLGTGNNTGTVFDWKA